MKPVDTHLSATSHFTAHFFLTSSLSFSCTDGRALPLPLPFFSGTGRITPSTPARGR